LQEIFTFFVTPSFFYVAPSEARGLRVGRRPERRGGSLGAYAPREDTVGNVASSPFFVIPRRKPRNLCLMTKVRDASPSFGTTEWDADASLSLVMTRLKGQGGVRGSFEQPTGPIVRINFSAKVTGYENLSFWLLWGKKPWG
jgi:hypothetical protein